MSRTEAKGESLRALEATLREVRAARDEDLPGKAGKRMRGRARARDLALGLAAVAQGDLSRGMAHLAQALGEAWPELPGGATVAKKSAKKVTKKSAKKAAKKSAKKAAKKSAKKVTKKSAKKAAKKSAKKAAKKSAKKVTERGGKGH